VRPFSLVAGGRPVESRDKQTAKRLAALIRSCGTSLSLLVCTDGWKPYKEAFLKGFRFSVRTGKRGRPRLALEEGFLMGQVVKQYQKKRVHSVVQRVFRGTEERVVAVVKATRGGTGINTAFIERLNATFRSRLAPLARRTRNLARKATTLEAGMFLVGTVYNFCTLHETLSRTSGTEKIEQTPAMAAQLTDHCWTLLELFSLRLPPGNPPPKKRRGRPPKTFTNQSVVVPT